MKMLKIAPPLYQFRFLYRKLQIQSLEAVFIVQMPISEALQQVVFIGEYLQAAIAQKFGTFANLLY